MSAEPFAFPLTLHYLVAHDVWACAEEGGLVRVGITALGTALSGELYMCRAKPVGAQVEQGRGLAVVEVAKAIVSVKSPLSGEVVERNARVEDRPELVQADPYGAGWLALLRPADWAADAGRLVTGAAVSTAMAERLRLMRPELKCR